MKSSKGSPSSGKWGSLMFDIFHKKSKIEELEDDIKSLYGLYESAERHRKCSEVFESFCSNQREIDVSRGELYPSYAPYIEKTWEDVSIKTVMGMVLEKMGLKVSYTPVKIRHVIPSEFKLVRKE